MKRIEDHISAAARLSMHCQRKLTLSADEFEAAFDCLCGLLEEANDEKFRAEQKEEG